MIQLDIQLLKYLRAQISVLVWGQLPVGWQDLRDLHLNPRVATLPHFEGVSHFDWVSDILESDWAFDLLSLRLRRCVALVDPSLELVPYPFLSVWDPRASLGAV